MYTLSVFEYGLIVNELFVLLAIAVSGCFWCWMNRSRDQDAAMNSVFAISLGLIAMEEWFSLQYWDRGFVMSKVGYMPTGEAVAIFAKPLMYAWALFLMYVALSYIFEKDLPVLKFKRMLFPLCLSIFAIMLTGYAVSNYTFSLLVLMSMVFMWLVVKSFNKDVQSPLVLSNFLFKTPLSRFASLITLAWFSYGLFFYLTRVDFYGSSEVYCLAYFSFVLMDFMVKVVPLYLIFEPSL